MSKRYAWPICTVTDCGHKATHKTEARARMAAKGNQRRFTTTNGDAVCQCHDGAVFPVMELPKRQFRCDEYAATARDRALEAEAPAPEPVAEPAFSSAAPPLDPRDNPEW